MGFPCDKLPVLEQFVTVQGEGRNLGVPYYFIRVGGCPLRCNFCDSEYTWKVDPQSIKDVAEVARAAWQTCNEHHIDWISITGGEPLLYTTQLVTLMTAWRAMSGGRLKVHIETSGRYYDEGVHDECDLYSADAKTPCTGEDVKGFAVGLDKMRSYDQVKCLIATDADFAYAHRVNEALDGRCSMVLQPFNQEILTHSTKNMSHQVAASRPAEMPDLQRVRRGVAIGFQWMLERDHHRCAQGEKWQDVVLTPQVHVLAYGNTPAT